MIEVDVLPTADGIPVVIHDADLYRLAGVRADVRKMSMEELSHLRITTMKKRGFGSEPIPVLRELLTWAKGKICLNIEIKPEGFSLSDAPTIAECVVSLITEMDMENQILISSFSPACLYQCKEMAPDIPRGVLYDKKLSEGLSPTQLFEKTEAHTLHLSYRKTGKRIIQWAANENIPLFVYTVNYQWKMKKLIRKGVKGIFSDKPGLLKKVADEEIARLQDEP